MVSLSDFIKEYVTKRESSMFLGDIENNEKELMEKIKEKSILVIGGGGSIGFSFYKNSTSI